MGHPEYLMNPEMSHLRGYTEVKAKPQLIHTLELQAITHIWSIRWTSIVGRPYPAQQVRWTPHVERPVPYAAALVDTTCWKDCTMLSFYQS